MEICILGLDKSRNIDGKVYNNERIKIEFSKICFLLTFYPQRNPPLPQFVFT